MLGHDIAAALPEMRAQAESKMVDACVITGGGGAPVWNETTGQYDTPAGVTVYDGKCEVQVPNVAEQSADVGEHEWTVQAAIVKLPVIGSEGAQIGHTVTITASTNDPQLVGCVYAVTGEHHKTYATARRLRCNEVTS